MYDVNTMVTANFFQRLFPNGCLSGKDRLLNHLRTGKIRSPLLDVLTSAGVVLLYIILIRDICLTRRKMSW